jgi:glycosyltransferase involved in cell wall biosynthesis
VPGFQKYDLAGYHRLTGPVIRRIWEGADGLVANSNGLADLARKFAPNLNIEVIPNGVDPNRFRPPAEPLDEWGPKWLFVGRLQRQKGVDTLLSALARLPRGRRGRLSVVGDGPLKPDLQRLAASLGLADDVDFMGWRSRSAMPGVYQAHQAFILPSRDEGMPNALLEAMAGGLPAIASRIAGNEELVVDGRTGFLTPVDDAESLARAMTRLADDPETARRMGRAARERAVGRYSWTRSAEAYLNLLETAARERKSKAAWL